MSDDWAVRSGEASEWEDPNPQKGKCKVGGRAVWVFRFKKDTDELTRQYQALKEAAIKGQWVKCEGPEYEGTMQSGKSYTSFTAYQVSLNASDVPHDVGVEGVPSGTTGSSTPAPPDDRQNMIQAQWALNAAVAISTSTNSFGIPESFKALPIEEKAAYLIAAAKDLAAGDERKEFAQGDWDAPPAVKEAF